MKFSKREKNWDERKNGNVEIGRHIEMQSVSWNL